MGALHWFFLFPTSSPWLYRKVHQLHHQHHLPFALAAQDASGAELLSLLLLALISAQLVGCHPLSEAVFHLVNTWLAVEDHCGYDLPWALHRLLPFMGGAPYHQAHHGLHNCNYAPYFTHWDHLFGTYQASRVVSQRQQMKGWNLWHNEWYFLESLFSIWNFHVNVTLQFWTKQPNIIIISIFAIFSSKISLQLLPTSGAAPFESCILKTQSVVLARLAHPFQRLRLWVRANSVSSNSLKI